MIMDGYTIIILKMIDVMANIINLLSLISLKGLYLTINVIGFFFFFIDDICDDNRILEHIKNNGLRIWHILLVTIFPVILLSLVTKILLINIGKVIITIGHKIYNIFNFTIYKKKEDNTLKE